MNEKRILRLLFAASIIGHIATYLLVRRHPVDITTSAPSTAGIYAAVQQKAADPEAEKDRVLAEFEQRAARQFQQEPIARFDDVMRRPDFAEGLANALKAQQDKHYARLYRTLKLTPAQIDVIRDVLAAESVNVYDTTIALQSSGVEPLTKAQAVIGAIEIDAEELVKRGIPEDCVDDVNAYRKTLPLRNALDELALRLSYSGEPLSDTRYEELVRVMIDDKQIANRLFSAENQARAIAPDFSMGIDKRCVEAAQTVLSDAQLEVFRKIYSEQAKDRSLARKFNKLYGETK